MNITVYLGALEGNDKSYISGAKHQNLIARKNTMKVHHCLRCPRTDNSR